MLPPFRPLVFAIALAVAAFSASADEPREHDRVRAAVMRGEIRPLADILGAVRGKLPGEIAGVEIEQKAGRWMYEFRVYDRNGRLFEVYVDGQSGAIDRIKEK